MIAYFFIFASGIRS